jgi:hypothetical protein
MTNNSEINKAILEYREAKDKLENNLKRIHKLKLLIDREQQKTKVLDLNVKERESWLFHKIETEKLT